MLLTYAIGDVHGRSDLLQTVITFCEDDAARRGGTPRIVFLGDIVDRGRDAKGCLEIVSRVLADHPASVLVRGNRAGSGNLDTGHRWIFGLNAA